MTSPPKKEGVPCDKDAPRKTIDGEKISETQGACNKLLPANVEALLSRGVAFEWRKSTHDLKLTCFCGAKLIMDEARPWCWCFANHSAGCPANRMIFEGVLWRLR
jgi:hypothetical protein